MKAVSLSVRCTREEYMAYCVQRTPTVQWLTGIGVLMLIMTVLSCIVGGGFSQGSALLLLIALVCLLMKPLILPTVIRGEAGRRYDASDSLKQAISLVIDEKTLTIRSATVEGSLPLESMNDMIKTNGMIALIFGKELTVCIPKRALSDEEQQILEDIANTYVKD